MPVPPLFEPPATLLHRIRFLDHTPSPITALAFAPLPLPPSIKGKEKAVPGREELGVLVLARENGEVELWEWERGDEDRCVGNWVLQKVCLSYHHRPVRAKKLTARSDIASYADTPHHLADSTCHPGPGEFSTDAVCGSEDC